MDNTVEMKLFDFRFIHFLNSLKIISFSGKLKAIRTFMILACLAYGDAFISIIMWHVKKELNIKFFAIVLFGACK